MMSSIALHTPKKGEPMVFRVEIGALFFLNQTLVR